jgi:hypothetical protein
VSKDTEGEEEVPFEDGAAGFGPSEMALGLGVRVAEVVCCTENAHDGHLAGGEFECLHVERGKTVGVEETE